MNEWKFSCLAFQIVATVSIALNVLLVVAYLLFGTAKTTYSLGYNSSAFSRAECGITKSDLVKLIGEPFAKHEQDEVGEQLWTYSKQSSPTSDYDYRAIIFDRDGHLKQKICEFYID